jgi:MarR family transcriptional regulator, organic hydroperoxide resistance regulator
MLIMDMLKLENQLCFPLYACSKEVVKKYKPYLDEIGLTYTQYITMMVLWDKKEIGVKQLGECLYLDSGTLTPLLKKLEKEGLVNRVRSSVDERNLIVSVTEKGLTLKGKAYSIPEQMRECMEISPTDAGTLYQLLYKLLDQLK